MVLVLRIVRVVAVLCVLVLMQSSMPYTTLAQDSTLYNRLTALGKVWGFLKYYHPGAAQGKNWDQALFDAISDVKSAQSKGDFNTAIDVLLRKAGTLPTGTGVTVPSYLEITIDTKWMSDTTMLSAPIIQALDQIKRAFKPFDNYYIGASNVGTPQAQNETSYSQTFPTESVRLLALFRYWNIINYYYPYKDVIGRNWDSVLREFVPQFLSAAGTDYHLLVRKLSAQINDSHGFVVSSTAEAYFGYYTFPFTLRYVEGKTIITGFTTSYDLSTVGLGSVAIGDEIIAIDGIPVETLRSQLAPYTPASNPSSLQRDINLYLLRGKTPTGSLSLKKAGSPQEITLSTVQRLSYTIISQFPVSNSSPVWNIMPGNIGYVDMGRLQKSQVATMMSDLIRTQGIVFDIRNYPNGTLYAIAAYLGTSTPFVKFTTPNPTIPGTFVNPYFLTYYAGNQRRYSGKTAVLMNQETQSQAEFTCMCLKAVGATLIGIQTAGADGDIVTLSMPGAITVYYTSLGVYYPDGSPTQRIGIVPDIAVKPTVAGIQAGRDEVLERAIGFINGTISAVANQPIADDLLIAPNPVSDVATISYNLPSQAKVTLRMFSTIGSEVLVLPIGNQSAGTHSAYIPTTSLPQGVYLCRLEMESLSGNSSQMAKLLVLNK